ncbi:MAG: 2-octaprenyl-6-methoxyphenyl hydroxylase [Verrucomicrobiaceae bacterium]|nr:2-octaprenyl-6-methoxyphenyl hydroxylase [Verrucomicrobiaceae bacterium]
MSQTGATENVTGASDYDVVIAGGGMVGISFALLLNRLSRANVRILVAESFTVPASTNGTPVYRPSFDARATALSYGSRCILENLGIWNTLQQHATSITDIHVSERNRFGSVALNAQQRGWPALGTVVENAWLGNVLISELRKQPGIEWLSPAQVIDCQNGIDGACITIDHDGTQKTVTTKLLAIADGAQSGLRTRLNIGTREHDYQQQAIIANICCDKPHAGWAYERFTDWGPMALLPLTPASDAAPRMALVWTMKGERAQELLSSSDAEFLATLQQRFGQRQGRFTRVGQRYSYDLKLTEASEQIRRQIVLIGNAAHSLHPVAGQGFNLALRDVQRLAEVIAQATAECESIGELTVLRRYRERQQLDQTRTLIFSNRITALFEKPGLVVGGLRHVGLLALDLNVDLKNRFVDQTAGFHPGAALGNAIG